MSTTSEKLREISAEHGFGVAIGAGCLAYAIGIGGALLMAGALWIAETWVVLWIWSWHLAGRWPTPTFVQAFALLLVFGMISYRAWPKEWEAQWLRFYRQQWFRLLCCLLIGWLLRFV